METRLTEERLTERMLDRLRDRLGTLLHFPPVDRHEAAAFHLTLLEASVLLTAISAAPPPREERTCATCQHWRTAGIGLCGKGIAPHHMAPPATFYCALHAPLTPSPPSASPGETQE